jgi:hypothetical protein
VPTLLAGAWGVALGFALVAMWAQGVLEVSMRWRTAARGEGSLGARHGRATRATAVLVLTRCVYPAIARAVMLELVSLAMRVFPDQLTVFTLFCFLGGVCLPISRAVYRTWQGWHFSRHVAVKPLIPKP